MNTLVSALGRSAKPLEAYDVFLSIPEKYGLHFDCLSFSIAIGAVSADGLHLDKADNIFSLLNSTKNTRKNGDLSSLMLK